MIGAAEVEMALLTGRFPEGGRGQHLTWGSPGQRLCAAGSRTAFKAWGPGERDPCQMIPQNSRGQPGEWPLRARAQQHEMDFFGGVDSANSRFYGYGN